MVVQGVDFGDYAIQVGDELRGDGGGLSHALAEGHGGDVVIQRVQFLAQRGTIGRLRRLALLGALVRKLLITGVHRRQFGYKLLQAESGHMRCVLFRL